jgi:hypothetical protein
MVRVYVVAFVALVIGTSVGCSARRQERAIVRNSTGAEMTDINLILQRHGGTDSLSKSAVSLPDGESLVVEHSMLDLSVQLSYRIAGASYEHCEAYVDLWAGEGWLLDVQPDGTVRSRHDYPEHTHGALPSP